LKAVVSIRFKPGVLDPEAQAIERALARMGFGGVGAVRRTRVLELELEAADRAGAEAQVEAMCERLLANPVIETYDIQLSA
jgi:phosphoribosylformylglycinamidine synthase PurS subunit